MGINYHYLNASLSDSLVSFSSLDEHKSINNKYFFIIYKKININITDATLMCCISG